MDLYLQDNLADLLRELEQQKEVMEGCPVSEESPKQCVEDYMLRTEKGGPEIPSAEVA